MQNIVGNFSSRHKLPKTGEMQTKGTRADEKEREREKIRPEIPQNEKSGFDVIETNCPN